MDSNPTLAIIINGCIRDNIHEYIKVINNLINKFEYYYIIDIYFHTWDTFEKTNVSKHEYSYDKELLLKSLYSIKNIKVIIDKPFIDKYYDENNFPYNMFNVSVNYKYKQSRTSIYNCSFAYNSLINAVNESKKKYDYILRCRNDLFLNINDINNLNHKISNDYICIPPNLWYNVKHTFLNDHFVIAKSEIIMSGLFSTTEEIKDIVKKSWNGEEVMYNLLSRTKKSIYIFDINGEYLILNERRNFNK